MIATALVAKAASKFSLAEIETGPRQLSVVAWNKNGRDQSGHDCQPPQRYRVDLGWLLTLDCRLDSESGRSDVGSYRRVLPYGSAMFFYWGFISDYLESLVMQQCACMPHVEQLCPWPGDQNACQAGSMVNTSLVSRDALGCVSLAPRLRPGSWR